MIKIAPSILSADFAALGAECADVERAGAELLHVDVMDGMFVPNISLGIPVIKSLRKATEMFLDVHLMIEQPVRYAEAFCKAGADLVNFHVESDTEENILHAIELVRAQGKKVGVTLKPKTPAEAVLPYLGLVDLILIMTVEPGFGGQRFMADMLPKIRRVRALVDEKAPGTEIEVDGGIDASTAPLVTEAGATVLVAGSAVFGKPDRAAAIREIRDHAVC